MSDSFSAWADIFRRRQPASAGRRLPALGEVYAHTPEHGPVEYAEVIGVYKEAADIHHVRFRLVYGYQEKTVELGDRTLAAALFQRHFSRRIATESDAAE